MSQLPLITDPVTIDGATQPGFPDRPIVVISGLSAGPNVSGLLLLTTNCIVRNLAINNLQSGNGIEIYGGGNNVIQGNYIGADPTGTHAARNDWSGILVYNGSSGNLIGGTTPAEGNVIANQGRSGIHLAQLSRGNVVQGNWIGTDATATNRMGNRLYGVHIQDSSQNTVGGAAPGAGNVIAYNEGDGVFVESGANNTILGNLFHANGGLGIDLGTDGVNLNDANDSDSGANQLQNYPLITSVTTNAGDTITIQGTMRSLPNVVFTLEFFASPTCDPSDCGEGFALLARTNLLTDSAGNLAFAFTVPRPAHDFITATATSGAGGTSEFSPCVQVGGVLPPITDLGSAVNATNLTWSSGGHSSWVGQTTPSHDGAAAAHSGTITDSRQSWLQTTVDGPGLLAFWWRVSSEMDFDQLEFSIDTTVQRRISGEEDWEQPFFRIPAGSHILRWRYSKDESLGFGQDRGWVDEVAFLPESGPPVVVAQPVSLTAGAGDTVNLAAGVAGAFPRTYQWFRNETERIEGATNASLTLADVGPDAAGRYRLAVSNAAGSTASSNAVLRMTGTGPLESVLVLYDASFTSPYRTALTNLGFTYEAFSDNGAFNAAVASANPATTLVIVDVPDRNAVLNPVGRFAAAGGRAIVQYWALNAGSALAAAFNASVVPPLLTTPRPVYDWGGSPLFAGLTSPLSLVDRLGYDGAVLQPIAGGQALAGYSSMPAANQVALIVGHGGRTLLSGFMLVEISDPNDAVTLARNQIQSLIPPVLSLLRQPQSHTVRQGSSVTNSVIAVSPTGPITYQWRFNGMDLPGATGPSLMITNAQLADEGRYSVVVSDGSGSITSRLAMLTVLVNLTVVQPVISQSVVAGGDVTFSVEFAGNPPPFGYEWRRVSPATSLASNVSNERVAFFTLTNVQTNQSGNYRVIARNAASPSGAVSSFSLSVLADNDGDGLPNEWELTHPTATEAAEDTDHDGLTNLEEYRAGTDPADPVNVLRIERIDVGNAATLRFPARANKTYTVQYQEDLNDRRWLKLTDVLARSTNRTEVIADPASSSQRQYRLVTPSQP